jgi:hypothetical protein
MTQWHPPSKVPVLAREIKQRRLIRINAKSNERESSGRLAVRLIWLNTSGLMPAKIN